jgi:transposase
MAVVAADMPEKGVLLAQDSGVVSHCLVIEEDVVGQGTRLSVADRRRNARLERLRVLVPLENAILGIDLADVKQHAVLCDHDSRVVQRWKVSAKAWQLGALLDRAVEAARRAGFASVTVACEPTGHRWQIVQQMAAERGLPMVCVQPLAMRRARELEDYTTEKTDAKDSVLIARQTAQLRCYVPEQVEEVWGQLRHAGIRRVQLVAQSTGQRQQIRDLLECVWPAVLAAAPKCLFDSATWLACLQVVLSRCDGRPERLRRHGLEPFAAAVRAELARFGGLRLQRHTVRAVWAALTDPVGVRTRRAGALHRVGWILTDFLATRRALAEVETRLVDTLDQLDLTDLVSSIPGVNPVGAAAILAETGDPSRFSHARAMVKHAGLAPRAQQSGEYHGTTRLTGRGRPRLRLAAWRAVFGALHHNPALLQRYQHLTTRPHNPLTDGQARASLAATLLRWIHVITTQRIPWTALTTTRHLTEEPRQTDTPLTT